MKLLDIKEKDYDFIYKLTNNKEVIQHIAKGLTWDEEKVKTFIKYNLEEQQLSNDDRIQFYYIIHGDDKDIGIIGFYKELDKNYHLRIFLDTSFQGKGYFSKSLELVKSRLKKYKNVDKLYAEVHQTNEKMNAILRRKYFFNGVKYKGGKPLNQYIIFLKNYTYLVKSDYIPEKVIDQIFKARGNWSKFVSGTYPDFLRLDGNHYFDKNNRKYKPIIKNIVNDQKTVLTVKSKLIKTLGNKPYLPNTFIFSHREELLKISQKLMSQDRAWILKPDRGYSGEGIQISLKRDLEKVKLAKKFNRWSLQEYIPNPLLINDRKFHIRLLFLYRANPNPKERGNSFWFKHMPIYLAKKPFVYDNFEDEDIHISHYSDEQKPLYLQDLPVTKKQLTSILLDIKLILIDLADALRANCYPGDSKRCYELFGVDLMITQDFEVKLIEFNSKLGLKEFTKDPLEFNKKLLEAELRVTADHFLHPKNTVENKNCDFVLIR